MTPCYISVSNFWRRIQGLNSQIGQKGIGSRLEVHGSSAVKLQQCLPTTKNEESEKRHSAGWVLIPRSPTTCMVCVRMEWCWEQLCLEMWRRRLTWRWLTFIDKWNLLLIAMFKQGEIELITFKSLCIPIYNAIVPMILSHTFQILFQLLLLDQVLLNWLHLQPFPGVLCLLQSWLLSSCGLLQKPMTFVSSP